MRNILAAHSLWNCEFFMDLDSLLTDSNYVSYFFVKKNNYELDLNPTFIVADAFHGSNEPQPGCSGIRKDPLMDAMKCIQDEPDDYEDE